MKGVIWKKDEPVPKLWREKLRLNARMMMKDETDLKGKTVQSSTDYLLANSKCQGHQCNFTQAASCAYK
jgi:hypothetical protein